MRPPHWIAESCSAWDCGRKRWKDDEVAKLIPLCNLWTPLGSGLVVGVLWSYFLCTLGYISLRSSGVPSLLSDVVTPLE